VQDRSNFDKRFPDLSKLYAQGRRLKPRPLGGVPSMPPPLVSSLWYMSSKVAPDRYTIPGFKPNSWSTNMEQHRYKAHLLAATDALLQFMRSLVANPLPNECRYLVSLAEPYYYHLASTHSIHLGQPFQPAVEGFPLMATERGYVRAVTADDVIAILWFDGAIPAWINVEVHSADTTFTYVKLQCCDRITADDAQLYHHDEGYPPFHVLSGYLPSGWESVERDGKFDLSATRR
jgi:hypothetical protein